MNKVLVEYESHRDVARHYRVSPNIVALLVHKVKANPKLLAEIHSAQQGKLDRKEAVSRVVDDLNQ